MPFGPRAPPARAGTRGRSRARWRALVVGATVAGTGLTAFEALKQLLVPQISLWESHILTIGAGAVLGALAFLLVMRRHERLLQELEQAERQFRDLVEHTSDWIWQIDERRRYVYVSPRIEQLLGYRPEELLGRTPFEFMPREEAGRVEAAFAELEARREPISLLENTNLGRDGRRAILETSALPLFDADGTFRGYRGIDRDITERRRVEQERELFLHTISHDLRAPLALIQGHAQLLERKAAAAHAAPGLARSIHLVREGARRMDLLLRDLVDVARSGSGQLVLERRPLDLVGFLEEVLQRNEGVLARARVFVHVPAGLPAVEADPERLERIVVNLLSNALKYSPGQAPVRVSARPEGEALVVSISDLGQGIAEEDVPHLFDAYYRAPAARHGAEGLGLGLYIVRTLVEAHGGRVWVQSRRGVGSTFSFALPAHKRGSLQPEPAPL